MTALYLIGLMWLYHTILPPLLSSYMEERMRVCGRVQIMVWVWAGWGWQSFLPGTLLSFYLCPPEQAIFLGPLLPFAASCLFLSFVPIQEPLTQVNSVEESRPPSPALIVPLVVALLPPLWHCHPLQRGIGDMTKGWITIMAIKRGGGHISKSISSFSYKLLVFPDGLQLPSAFKRDCEPFTQIPQWVPWQTTRNSISSGKALQHTSWRLLFLPSSLSPSPALLISSLIPKSGTPKLLPQQCKRPCHEGEVGSAWKASTWLTPQMLCVLK